MPDLAYEQESLDLAWESAAWKTQLPPEWADFWEHGGLVPHHAGCRRAYQRIFIRSKALLSYKGKVLGVYSADASRGGIRFLSPLELSIEERAAIQLPQTKVFQIEIVRCRRLAEACFDCGAMFVLAKASTPG